MIGVGAGLLLRNPLVRKVAIGAGIAVALFFAYRWWSNALYERGLQDGILKGIEETEKKKQAEWDEIQAKLDTRRQELQLAFQELETERETLEKSRITIRQDLNRGITRIQRELQKGAEEVALIPSSELNATIRQLLADTRPGAMPKPEPSGPDTDTADGDPGDRTGPAQE